MNLNEQIRQTIDELRITLPATLNALIEQGAGEISAMDITGSALKAGDSVPMFDLGDYRGRVHSISDYLANGPLVLTFYRGVWCPYCNLQLAEYNRRLRDFRTMGADLVAISPQSPNAEELFLASDAPASAKEFAAVRLDFNVLHDRGNRVAEKFGLVFDLPQAHRKLFDLMNLDIESIQGDSRYAVPDPATYVISENGRIHWAFVPNNYRKRAEADEIIEALVTA